MSIATMRRLEAAGQMDLFGSAAAILPPEAAKTVTTAMDIIHLTYQSGFFRNEE